MNRQLLDMRRGIGFPQHGMTLLEMLITITLLGSVMAGTLTLYANIMKTNRQRDTIAGMIEDSDRILTTVEQDIRHAVAIDPNYALAGTYAVVAALPRAKNGAVRPQTLVYAFDAAQPKRLLRILVTDDVHVTELATGVKTFTLRQTSNALVQVELILEHIVAGETKTWQTSTVFSTLDMQ